MAAASNVGQKLDILVKAAELTKDLRKPEQAAVIGLLKLDPKSIEDETTRLQIMGVQQSLTEKIKSGVIDHSMLETVNAIHRQYVASKQGGRRKRRKSRKTKRKRRKSRKRRKKRTKKKALSRKLKRKKTKRRR